MTATQDPSDYQSSQPVDLMATGSLMQMKEETQLVTPSGEDLKMIAELDHLFKDRDDFTGFLKM